MHVISSRVTVTRGVPTQKRGIALRSAFMQFLSQHPARATPSDVPRPSPSVVPHIQAPADLPTYSITQVQCLLPNLAPSAAHPSCAAAMESPSSLPTRPCPPIYARTHLRLFLIEARSTDLAGSRIEPSDVESAQSPCVFSPEPMRWLASLVTSCPALMRSPHDARHKQGDTSATRPCAKASVRASLTLRIGPTQILHPCHAHSCSTPYPCCSAGKS